MTIDSRQSFVGEVVGRHGRKLRRYLAARVLNATDVADLAQEVFLRLMRVDRHDMIRSPESYLFTIASHVLAQHHLRRSAEPESVDIHDPDTDEGLSIEPDHAVQIDLQRRAKELESAIGQLPPNPQACLRLHCREGWTLDEIATRLGVSRSMVKKHIAKAMLHCRQQLKDWE
ncbi:MAG: RNA polymerase sigma factor [Gammaproteobacteria bacterium]